MSPLSALAFALAALGLLASDKRLPRPVSDWGFEWLLPTIGGVISGLVLLAYASGPPVMSGERLIPMALPAAMAFLLLNAALFVLSAPESLREALRPQGSDERTGIRRHIVVAGLGVAALLGLAALVYVRREQAAARQGAYGHLDAIARLKAAQIEDWRRERLLEAEFLHRTPPLAADILKLLTDSRNPRARAGVVRWMENIRRADRYADVRLFDSTGRTILAVPESAPRPPPEFLAAALGGARVVVTDIHRNGEDPAPHLDLILPIRANAAEAQAEAAPVALVLRIDPRRSLFPLLAQWPVRTASAEMILMRIEGRNLRYLSDLRGGSQSRPRPLPWSGEAPQSESPSLFLDGRDYRGLMTLSALRRVGGSDWLVEAKIDQAEAYAPVRVAVLQSGLLAGLLLTGMALSAAFIARARRADHLAKMLSAEHNRRALADRLAVVTDHATDAILLLDRDMKIVEANERVRTMYGRSPDEMRGLILADLHPKETKSMAKGSFERIFNGGPDLLETWHVRANGDLVPVEVSAQAVSVGGERYMLGVVRDITQRKAHQAEIERLNRLYTALSEVNASIVRAGKEPFLNEACRALSTRGGFPMVWVGQLAQPSGLVYPVAQFGDPGGFLVRLDGLRSHLPEGRGPAGRAIADNAAFSCRDHLDNPLTRPWREAAESFGFAASIAIPIRPDGQPWGALCVYAADLDAFGKAEVALLEDVAEAIALGIEHGERETLRAEAQAREVAIQNRLNATLSAIPDLMFEMGLHGEYHSVHSPRSELLAAPTAELSGKTVHDVLPFGPAQAVIAAIRETHETGLSLGRQFELRLPPPEGDCWFELSVSRGPAGPDLEPRFIVLSRDITSRKAAENALRRSLHEKEALLKEVHHRVKNNLQVITSLLRLESHRGVEPSTRNVLKEMQGRIRSMALIHETLYRSGDFASIDLGDYLRQLAQQLFRAQNSDPSRVRLTTELAEIHLDLDHAIPCGLIANELLSNSLKYAFPEGRAGEIRLSLSRESDQSLCLRVEDTGVGLAPDFETRRATSLGLQLVQDLSRQLEGGFRSRLGPGARSAVFLPDPRARSAATARTVA